MSTQIIPEHRNCFNYIEHAQDRLELARERMNGEKERTNWLHERSACFGQQDQPSFVAAPLPARPRYASTPALGAQISHQPIHKAVERVAGQDSTSNQPSKVIAQLEYNRALRLWADANEKVRELCSHLRCALYNSASNVLVES